MKRKIILSVFAITLGICSCGNPVKTKIALMTKLEAGSTVGRSEINATKIFIEKYKANDIELYFMMMHGIQIKQSKHIKSLERIVLI
jgi:hypothetical protein